jgi:hypothetical protein
MTSKRRCVAAGLVALAIGVAAPVRAQTPARNESQLLSDVARYPRQISNYLDLARLYVDQGRYDEAERILMQAIGAIRAQKMMTVQPGAVAGSFQVGPPTPPVAGQPLRVGGGVTEPKKIHDVKPFYPEIARAAGVKGVVILELTIDEQGDVKDAKILRCSTKPPSRPCGSGGIRRRC